MRMLQRCYLGAEKFLAGLEGIGVVRSSAHTAVMDNVFRHCLRRHQPNVERDNGPRSCIIPHIAVRIPGVTEIGELPCCGAGLSMSVAPTTGRHTASIQNVE
ncbi:hypothetical protein DFJ58DRAFT_808783 [Suillus subalutaceus]|uniref:uncharacterized protein n=1 Tax=Suillus subalutaceus TaxID=48586 RepID=UPI001B884426|nr:uncharacterized protein DFJ58DRAFT_808783 [Suillus subalutaceus]KAG1841227.1 hypothetical protein DFJ58DRAFT_808783 [Suillus subalutaceus]